MGGTLLEKVEQHTRLAGHNRVAMLLFRLGDEQLFGINVFKVREVLRRPPLERMPGVHALLAGSCDYRGQTIPVIDLAAALGYAPLREVASAHLMVTEFSRSVQGFLVADLQRMVQCAGETLVAPPSNLGFGARVNAVTRIDGALMAVVDVEHVLASIDAAPAELSMQMQRAADTRALSPRRVMVVDDSLIARRRLVGLFKQMNIECVVATDGREALERLQELAVGDPADGVRLVVSDIEMPRLDGYALTRAIREAPGLRQLKVVLHSSLSGIFNEAMVKEVKADGFVAKFQPDLLAQAVLELLPEPAETPAG
ncbi:MULTISPECIES: chemotaxis protein [Rhodanobacter]|uniref:chemotaxis protein n=1 Tax=Rhodanobacter TaxID=75309 RepID=UPI000260E628|nr:MULTISPECIES: chemotaxis protein [Rhodanobacter]EIM01792.1 chemotaxis signal transduction protein [Rhodanobacter denitrificans]KZC19647.1 chemotaxis protein [Rhodanobacter denitrificans]UJJ50204.1 chemotaxis protein [Rhodanobacter denitrificans]UJM91475.1 chemotaxis protein [Rhodanobacter denitrificans]UJM92919.1 chemotaxis protein [Rhodanobacter denitrificans]